MIEPRVDLCACGCPADAHDHYRPGTDCGRCGAAKCPRYRKVTVTTLPPAVALPALSSPTLGPTHADLQAHRWAAVLNVWAVATVNGPNRSELLHSVRLDPRCLIVESRPVERPGGGRDLVTRPLVNHVDTCTCGDQPPAITVPAPEDPTA